MDCLDVENINESYLVHYRDRGGRKVRVRVMGCSSPRDALETFAQKAESMGLEVDWTGRIVVEQ